MESKSCGNRMQEFKIKMKNSQLFFFPFCPNNLAVWLHTRHLEIFSHTCKDTHLNVPVGQQQVDDYVGGEQLNAVQPCLDVAQLLAQLLAAEALPCLADLMPDRLPEVLAVGTRCKQVMTYPISQSSISQSNQSGNL